MFYSLVSILGQDPVWSVTLSQTWCAKTEWVHLDTTLFYAATRDASVLLSKYQLYLCVLLKKQAFYML